MTKHEFMQRLSAKTGFTQVSLNLIYQAALEIIADEIAQGGRIHLKDLGIFSSKWRKDRRLVTPRGEVVEKKAGVIPVFKFSKDFRERF